MIKAGILTEEEFEKIISKDILTIVDFSAIWCGPCKMLEPVLEDASEKYNGKIQFLKIDVDSCEDLAKKFGIMAVPTIIAFKNGKMLGRTSGFMMLDELENFIINL